MDLTHTRGYRNNNPGNIDYNPSIKWQGCVGIEAPPLDGGRPRFARFSTPEFGVRTIAKLLQTYQQLHGLHTVEDMINRWAPPVENATSSYVAFVCKSSGFAPRQHIDAFSWNDVRPLVLGIIGEELGGNPYSDATIDAGLFMAGVLKPKGG